MDETAIIAKLDKLQSSVDSLFSMLQSIIQSNPISKDVNNDRIRSNQSESIRSGSDQISNDCSNLIDKFRETCSYYGISVHHKDLSSALRAIDFYFTKVNARDPKKYLLKMLESIPDAKQLGFTPGSKQNEHPTKLADIDTTVMGVDIAKIEEMKPYMDERTYIQTREFIPKWQSMFKDWASVSSSQLKLNIIIAYAINNGLM